jgi:hypothetical protein
MADWKCGDLVEFDGLLGAVIGIEGDRGVPENHVAVWFGSPRCLRKSQGGTGGQQPEVWTVPAEYVVKAPPPLWKH